MDIFRAPTTTVDADGVTLPRFSLKASSPILIAAGYSSGPYRGPRRAAQAKINN